MMLKICLVFVGYLAICSSAQEIPRIIRGQPASISDYPYDVSLRLNNRHFCGGSIYNNQRIVTAAHCVDRFKTNTTGLSIVAGQTRLSETNGQNISVSKVILHPQFRTGVRDYDVAVLHLASSLTFNQNVSALDNIANNRIRSGIYVDISGWGSTRIGGDNVASDVLMATKVRVQSRLSCYLQYFFRLSPRMFCAGNPLGDGDSCRGDSGSPVTYDGQMVGIVAFGRGCGNLISPGVYTDASTVRRFIIENASS